jgi:brefeldin A-inhibited guanine nucleotide-exchange protein
LLEETTEDEIAGICIEGFTHSIKICGYYNMTTEREAFVSSLAKFTLMTHDRKLQMKHIQVIQKIIELATLQGNYLGESWKFILECVSKLEEMINLGSGQMKDRDFFESASSGKNPKASQASSQQRAIREATMKANSELIV